MSGIGRRLAVLCLGAVGVSTPQGDAAAALDKLRGLVGRWEGRVEWTGARTGGGDMTVSYSLTGYGSAVVENLGGEPAMTSVYHLDGADLRMTHFCGMQNQPRLKASRIDLAHGIVDFSFVDVTNLRSPDAEHVHEVELRFLDTDHLILTFVVAGGDKQSRERIDLRRVSTP